MYILPHYLTHIHITKAKGNVLEMVGKYHITVWIKQI